jgi:hypothetical protein
MDNRVKTFSKSITRRVKGVKSSKMTTALKSGASAAMSFYKAGQDMGVHNKKELKAIAVAGAVVAGVIAVASQNEMPWSFTVETDCGKRGHFEIRGQQGVALTLHYIGPESHSMKYFKLAVPHNTKRPVDISVPTGPADRCRNHLMSVCEVAAVHLVLGGLTEGEKLGEKTVLAKWNWVHFNRVHNALHTRTGLGACAYCSNNLWAEIGSKYETNKSTNKNRDDNQ